MQQSALDIITKHAQEGARAREEFFSEHSALVLEAAQMLSVCLARKGKILLCGNGGSAADAQHVAAEFVNRFMLERPPLPAIALSTDTSILTSIGNDYSFEQIFSKQVLALGQPGDVLVAISTSGGSPNVLKAIEAARERGMKVIGLSGKDGGKMAGANSLQGHTPGNAPDGLCDILLNVRHASTPVIQEVHLAVEHLLCRLCDYYLFENVGELMPLLEAQD